jgi:DNA polymerase-1
MERVWASPHALDILPAAQIHDSLYFLIKDDTATLKWVNDNLIECMQWQDHPDIAHPVVKLGAELEVHYGTWDKPIKIPNQASLDVIRATCQAGAAEYDKKARL